ncbi:MAG: 2-oxo acid dehydrogenase subunit E2 [Kordiimonadaceae bacterium]|jgi:pyruvate/2-oxoglutarate dehydrogenase complex dihydrolipoamide acyltransferase (E2) component|nr:2-oxo acid dehydrogenase subunit E2 [Kordiimonadaceae bacterium]MBT6032594.1 2-oxo acid dehydrogenase subunit E2 [Kordiimonadaceae bacterium]
MFDFKLPDIGEGLAEAEFLNWSVKTGQMVKEGDVVAEISTDKVTVELAAPRSGQIHEICVDVGEVVKVGTVILRIDDQSSDQVSQESKPAEKQLEKPSKVKAVKVRTSPVVRRFATENKVDLANVIGSGSEGMILRSDVEAFIKQEVSQQSGDQIIKLKGAALSTAQNISKAANIMATTSISFDVNADQIAKCISENNLSPLTVISMCLIGTLKKHPKFNATIDEENNQLCISDHINLGIAVTASDQLLVPVLENIGSKNSEEISASIIDITARGRHDQLKPQEMRGSTFTLSSTGGIEQGLITSTTPIINHPNVAILWASRFTDRPWVSEGGIIVAKVMSCTLAFDHRYLHGADGFAFISDFEEFMQNPSSAL